MEPRRCQGLPSPTRLFAVPLGRDALDDDVAAADEDVRVRPHLDVAEQDPAAAGAALAVTVAGTVQLEPAGRSAFASVTATEPKAGLVNTST